MIGCHREIREVRSCLICGPHFNVIDPFVIVNLCKIKSNVNLKKGFPVLSFAFTSRTSAGALPLNIQTQNQLGVSEGIANFAGSFGLTIGQNGCAGIYPAMLAVMVAPTVGMDPPTPFSLSPS